MFAALRLPSVALADGSPCPLSQALKRPQEDTSLVGWCQSLERKKNRIYEAKAQLINRGTDAPTLSQTQSIWNGESEGKQGGWERQKKRDTGGGERKNKHNACFFFCPHCVLPVVFLERFISISDPSHAPKPQQQTRGSSLVALSPPGRDPWPRSTHLQGTIMALNAWVTHTKMCFVAIRSLFRPGD